MTSRYPSAIIAFVLLGTSVPAGLSAQESLRCSYETRQACANGECGDMESTEISYLVLPTRAQLSAAMRSDSTTTVTVKRCDDMGCNELRVEGRMRGGWVNFINLDHGYFLRLGKTRHEDVDMSAFTEVVSVRLSVLVGHGRCETNRSGANE